MSFRSSKMHLIVVSLKMQIFKVSGVCVKELKFNFNLVRENPSVAVKKTNLKKGTILEDWATNLKYAKRIHGTLIRPLKI